MRVQEIALFFICLFWVLRHYSYGVTRMVCISMQLYCYVNARLFNLL